MTKLSRNKFQDVNRKFRRLYHIVKRTGKLPLRQLTALLDIDQSTLSKLEHGERPASRQMLPIIAKTFNVDEKEHVIKFLSKQSAYQLADEKYAKDILVAAE